MNYLKKIFSIYINSSVHVALAVSAFTMITAIEYEFKNSISLLCFIFFGTILGYSFIKFKEPENLFSVVLKSRNIIIFFFLLILLIFTLFCLLQLTFQSIIVTIILALFTILYSIPFLKNKSLRHFNGLKIFIVAFVWAGVTVFVPYLNEFSILTEDVILSFFQRFLMVLVLILPFEIRDLSVDASYLRTIPQKVGILQTKGLGVLLIGGCFAIEFFKDTINLRVFYTFGITLLVLFLFLIFAQKKQSKYYASFWVESIPILWMVLLLIFENFI